VAILLATLPLFFGLGGFHHFYTGRIGYGILQLFTCGGFLIWTLIDVINIAQGSFRDSENRLLAP